MAVRVHGAPAPQTDVAEFVEAAAEEFGMPGVAVGVWFDGHQTYACDGVTSLENPLPVDRDTLFLVGSVTKTFTATALMCLVASGHVALEAPVTRYLPELGLAGPPDASQITVLNLLNHTSGLDWGLIADTGEGEDALATYVARLAELDRIAPPGARASYSQAGYNLAGRIIETVTGVTYERAVASLVLEPLGLAHSLFARDDVMTRRFCVGHNLGRDGWLSVARLWRRARGDSPGGGIASSVADQLRWARFHLGDGRAEDGTRVLPAELMARMQTHDSTAARQHPGRRDRDRLVPSRRRRGAHRRPRRHRQRPVRGAPHRARPPVCRRGALQRRARRHLLQSGGGALGAGDVSRGGAARPGAPPV